MDPRNPKRPEVDAGSNWAHCRECDRGAHKAKLIRHRKHCELRAPRAGVKAQTSTEGGSSR